MLASTEQWQIFNDDRLSRVRSIVDLLPVEEFYRVKGSRVILLNPKPLLYDIFGHFTTDAQVVERQRFLHDWLAREVAVLSSPHRTTSEVHAYANLSSENYVTGVRFPRYGRASSRILQLPPQLVCQIPGSRPKCTSYPLWIDLKGTGLYPNSTPRCQEYSTGLLPLDEALEEFLWNCILDKVLEHAGALHRCLPIFAIVDLGFNYLDSRRKTRRASVLVRRGHFRDALSDLPRAFSQSHVDCLLIELLIRKYGVTSASRQPSKVVLEGADAFLQNMRYGGKVVSRLCAEGLGVCTSKIAGSEVDQINIQFGWSGLTRHFEIVDTVHFNSVAAFNRPLVSSVSNRPGAWGGVMMPDDPDFVRPDKAISLEKLIGWTADADGSFVKATRLECKELAQLVVEYGLEPAEVKLRLENLVQKATAILES